MLDPRTTIESLASAIGFRRGVGRLDALAVPCRCRLRAGPAVALRPLPPFPGVGALLPWTADIGSFIGSAALHVVAPAAIVE